MSDATGTSVRCGVRIHSAPNPGAVCTLPDGHAGPHRQDAIEHVAIPESSGFELLEAQESEWEAQQ